MTRALLAAAKSQMVSALDRVKLDPDEFVKLGLALAIEHAKDAGLDRLGLHALLDDGLAARSVEGEKGGAE